MRIFRSKIVPILFLVLLPVVTSAASHDTTSISKSKIVAQLNPLVQQSLQRRLERQSGSNSSRSSSHSSSSSSSSSHGTRFIQVPESGSSASTITLDFRSTAQRLPNEDLLRVVWQMLNNQYLYKDKIDQQKAAYAAAQALVGSLDDPYTIFMPPDDTEAFNTQIDGQVTGIGAQVEYVNNILTIVAPISGSPAEQAGLQAGDQILQANGEDITNIGFLPAVNKIRGPKGTTVVLHIKRAGNEFDISVIRDVVKLPEIDVSYQGNVAVVKLAQFGQTTDDDIRTMLATVASHKPSGLILDLRNNPGGLLEAADKVLSNFLPNGSTVAHVVGRDSETVESTSDDPTIDPSVKIVVLVNKGSASASEIVAGALQDDKRATILGETTYGKGTVQQVLDFKDNSSLKMTIAEWLTPLRRHINKLGVKPDVVVPAVSGRDDQMLRALDILR